MNDNNICKLCGEKNSFRQVLDLVNFPKSAQFMPAEHEFKLDFPLKIPSTFKFEYGNIPIS